MYGKQESPRILRKGGTYWESTKNWGPKDISHLKSFPQLPKRGGTPVSPAKVLLRSTASLESNLTITFGTIGPPRHIYISGLRKILAPKQEYSNKRVQRGEQPLSELTSPLIGGDASLKDHPIRRNTDSLPLDTKTEEPHYTSHIVIDNRQ